MSLRYAWQGHWWAWMWTKKRVATHQVHPLPALVMRDGDGPEREAVLWLDQPLHSVSDRVEGVEDVEEPPASREREVGSEGFDPANRQEDAERWPEGVEGRDVDVQALQRFNHRLKLLFFNPRSHGLQVWAAACGAREPGSIPALLVCSGTMWQEETMRACRSQTVRCHHARTYKMNISCIY